MDRQPLRVGQGWETKMMWNAEFDSAVEREKQAERDEEIARRDKMLKEERMGHPLPEDYPDPRRFRSDIFTLIDTERESQDKHYPWPENQHRKNPSSHILHLSVQVRKLEELYYLSRSGHDLEERLVKIAACAVRALQEIPYSYRGAEKRY